MTRKSRRDKEEEQALLQQGPEVLPEVLPEALVDCPTAHLEHLVCPRCAGNKRVMDFRAGDRSTGEPAGWKAVLCPDCEGVGNVDASSAAAILTNMEQDALS